jgi:hypothetical protein
MITGGRFGKETTYGLQDAYQKRIDTIKETIARKTAADKNYDPTELQNRLVDLKAAKAEEANILDFYTGDTIGANTELDIDTGNITGDASIAEQIEEQNKIEEAARIEAERRKLQEINAAAERERRETAEREQRETAEREAAIERNRIAEVTRQNEIRRQAEIDRLEAARREAARQNQGGGGGNNDRSGGRSSSSGESDYGGFCFDPSTLIQMADGSTKQIKNIQLGDATKGGEVTGVFQFKAADEIHDYKGVTVAGSHYVKENGKFIMVQDSPLAVKIDKIPVVYSLDTTGRRIFINDIEFADYNGDGVAKNFLSNAGVTIEGFDIEVLRQVEQRLI